MKQMAIERISALARNTTHGKPMIRGTSALAQENSKGVNIPTIMQWRMFNKRDGSLETYTIYFPLERGRKAITQHGAN